MAKSKKHTRKIVVDGAIYRWKIRDGMPPIVVFSESENGQTLVIHVPETPLYTITPRLVAETIKKAITEGWQPVGKSGEFYYHLPKELPIYKTSVGTDFYQAIIHDVTKKENGYTLKIKLPAKSVKYEGFHWIIVNFFDIENLSDVQSFFDDLIESSLEKKSGLPTINKIEFNDNFQSYIQNYHVLFDIDGLKPVTIHCKNFDRLKYNDMTLEILYKGERIASVGWC